MPKNRSRAARSSRSAPTGFRRTREPVYVCAEGATEEAYVRALLDHRYPGLFAPQFPGGGGRHPRRKTSLVNLLKAARDAEKTMTGVKSCIWVLCDADQNDVHQDTLERWVSENPDRHRAAIQSVSIEAWFLQHLDTPCRPPTNEDALRALNKQWKGYSKGNDIQGWLIAGTDRAVQRERAYLLGHGEDGLWPVARSSQMPRFIAYLDERASLLGWQGSGA